MNKAGLEKILGSHSKWLRGKAGGRRANLRDAYLGDANLRDANLRDADLTGANLTGANLGGADLADANLPSPTMMLLANWGGLSENLTRHLMRYDAANHPKPKAFDKWAVGGECPYSGIKIARAANFIENREWYTPGPAKSAYWLMVRVIREKCADSDYHVKKKARQP